MSKKQEEVKKENPLKILIEKWKEKQNDKK